MEQTNAELPRLPGLYETENMPLEDNMIYQRYFLGGSDWYMAEYDSDDRLFFGCTILNNDREMAEWGHTSLDALAHINIGGIDIDGDLRWNPKRFAAFNGNAENGDSRTVNLTRPHTCRPIMATMYQQFMYTCS